MRHTFVREIEEERTRELEREGRPRDQEHDDKYFNLDGIWRSVPTPTHETDQLCLESESG